MVTLKGYKFKANFGLIWVQHDQDMATCLILFIELMFEFKNFHLIHEIYISLSLAHGMWLGRNIGALACTRVLHICLLLLAAKQAVPLLKKVGPFGSQPLQLAEAEVELRNLILQRILWC